MYVGVRQSLNRYTWLNVIRLEHIFLRNTLTLCRAKVIANVAMGFTSGRTANEVSPTRPREVEAMASVLRKIFPPKSLTSIAIQKEPRAKKLAIRSLTLYSNAIESSDECPCIGGPVGMIQTPLESEQSCSKLRELAHKKKRTD